MEKKPALEPNNPQQIAHNKTDAGNQSIVNQVNGSTMVNDFVAGETDIPEPVVPNPYTIQSGGKNVVYVVKYKHLSYRTEAKNHLDALEKIFMKMRETVKNFKSKKSVVLSVQKYNKKRDNHIYFYKAKVNAIKHPVHKYRITFTKIKHND